CERWCRHCWPTRRSSNGPGEESRDGREGDRCVRHSAATFVWQGLNRNEDTDSLTRQSRVSERNIREAQVENPRERQTRGIFENGSRGQFRQLLLYCAPANHAANEGYSAARREVMQTRRSPGYRNAASHKNYQAGFATGPPCQASWKPTPTGHRGWSKGPSG